MNIHAYTETDYAPDYYPAFLSLNKRDGKLILSVRTRGAQNPSEIEMPAEALEQLAADIMEKLHADGA